MRMASTGPRLRAPSKICWALSFANDMSSGLCSRQTTIALPSDRAKGVQAQSSWPAPVEFIITVVTGFHTPSHSSARGVRPDFAREAVADWRKEFGTFPTWPYIEKRAASV